MQIKKKSDISLILENFERFANRDAAGNKSYIVFEDRVRGGQWTLMKYDDGRYSIHGLGADYHDDKEQFFEDSTGVIAFLWDNRAVYNAAARKITQEAAAAAE